jgi:hypothetical protein
MDPRASANADPENCQLTNRSASRKWVRFAKVREHNYEHDIYVLRETWTRRLKRPAGIKVANGRFAP